MRPTSEEEINRLALARWEHLTGARMPEPHIDGRLSPKFVEWMMGLPTGWVTRVRSRISRTQQLKMLGNGVVPQQAALAIEGLAQRALGVV